jgi:hypothetical protein
MLIRPCLEGIKAYPTSLYGRRKHSPFLIKSSWTPVDISNAGAFHGTLDYAGIHVGKIIGRIPPRRAFYHKMKAMRLINEWLNDSVEATSDATILSVAKLLTLEVWSDCFFWPTLHLPHPYPLGLDTALLRELSMMPYLRNGGAMMQLV